MKILAQGSLPKDPSPKHQGSLPKDPRIQVPWTSSNGGRAPPRPAVRRRWSGHRRRRRRWSGDRIPATPPKMTLLVMKIHVSGPFEMNQGLKLARTRRTRPSDVGFTCPSLSCSCLAVTDRRPRMPPLARVLPCTRGAWFVCRRWSLTRAGV